jgi:hypothetical protein
VINGLKLFMELEGDKHNVSAEHDVLFAGADTDDVTPEQAKQLEEWGWFQSEEYGGWQCFV